MVIDLPIVVYIVAITAIAFVFIVSLILIFKKDKPRNHEKD